MCDWFPIGRDACRALHMEAEKVWLFGISKVGFSNYEAWLS